MATDKSSAEDPKTLNDSKDSAQNGSKEQVAKPNGSKPNIEEISKRAYEIFKERQGGSALGDWQKAEASVSADAAKVDKPKVDTSKAAAPKANGAKSEAAKADAAQPDAAKSDAPKAEAAGTGWFARRRARKDAAKAAEAAKADIRPRPVTSHRRLRPTLQG